MKLWENQGSIGTSDDGTTQQEVTGADAGQVGAREMEIVLLLRASHDS